MTTLTGQGRTDRRSSSQRGVSSRSRGAVGVAERPSASASRAAFTSGGAGTATAPRPHASGIKTPQRTSSPIAKRMGSKQVISVRGRRVTSEESRLKRSTIQFVVIVLLLIGVGVGITMYFSGLTTQQSFEIQKAKAENQTLDNQLESLNRDVTNANSDAEIAKKAAQLGMVVPDQPGILSVGNNGAITENRPADPSKTHDVVAVGDGTQSQTQASSDPKKTSQAQGTVQPQTMTAAPTTAGLPYQNSTSTTAPQDTPLPINTNETGGASSVGNGQNSQTSGGAAQ